MFLCEIKSLNTSSRNHDLNQFLSFVINNYTYICCIFQLVTVQIEQGIYRAIVENIYSDIDENETWHWYQCWLLDYGLMVEAKRVYKLPLHLRKISPLAIQVSLNNFAYIHQVNIT